MQIYLSLMSQKNPSSDSSSYDLSSPQGRMLYVRETTNAAFSSWTSPLQRQDPDTQEEKKQEMLSRIMGKIKKWEEAFCQKTGFSAAYRSNSVCPRPTRPTNGGGFKTAAFPCKKQAGSK